MKPILWIRNTKCAGLSIKSAFAYPNKSVSLREIKGAKRVGRIHQVNSNHKLLGKVKPGEVVCVFGWRVKEFKENYPSLWKDSFKFSNVRNPFARFVSGWKYCPSQHRKKIKAVLQNMPKKSNFHAWSHISTMQTWGIIEDGKLVADLVRVENLEEDFNAMCKKCGLPVAKLPHQNKGAKCDFADFYDKESEAAIQEYFAEDFKYLNYDTHLPL